ncbi:MAG: T9SS type B sorting domain-containing protein [Bacteroidetes bacterium]|nr:MAG: T9SS type B sorting domain-containing protein [Bacteroidota bacterium]
MKYKPLFWAFLLLPLSANAQIFNMNGAPIASCSGTFFDSGGSAGNYSNNQNLTTTICPDGTGASHVLLHFDSVLLSPGDQLCIYDGSTVLAPLLLCFGAPPPGQPVEVQASAANTGGCLTLTFISDAAGTEAGWSAGISCAPPCVIPAPMNVQLISMGNGSMTWSWSPVIGSSGFEVSVNGGPFLPANGGLSHTVSGLVPGNLVVLEIRPVAVNPGCSVESITVNHTYVNCIINTTLSTISPASCAGTATGTVVITTTGAIGPVQYFTDTIPTPFPNGNFTNFFPAGMHQVIALDSAGCRDTVTFTIQEPPPIDIAVTVTDANCFGDNSGEIQAMASGGTGTFTYAWQGCQGGPIMNGSTAIDLFAGCYAVTVTDGNGCTKVAQDTIGEPEMFIFSSTQDSVSCFGGKDGMATVFVSGAMPPYTFKWSNGDTSQTADNLMAAFHSVTITDAAGCQAVTLVQVLQPPQLFIDSISTVPISCFGSTNGSATVFAHGGVQPFNYLWSNMQTGPTASGLGPGIYSVTLTDNSGCTATGNTQLSNPAELILQVTLVKPETCAGACNGEIQLSVSSGQPPYSISWNAPSIPPDTSNPKDLCAGNYQVTVTDAKGCTKTTSATVLAASQINISLTPTPPLCTGDLNGRITAEGTGGTAPYQYSWNTGATGDIIQNLGCGIYTVTVTDALGCTSVATDTLPCPVLLQLDSIQVKPVRCFGEANGLARVFVQGGTGSLTYLWSDPNQQFAPAAQDLPPGTYTVTVTDVKGCSITASATVTEPPLLTASQMSTSVSCFNSANGSITLTINGGVQPYSILWNTMDSVPQLTGLSAGTYSVTITDANNCTLQPPPVQITEPTSPVTVTAMQTNRACFDDNNGAALATASGSNGSPFTFLWSNGATGPAPNNFLSGTYTVTATDPAGCTGTQTVTISQWDSIFTNIAFVLPTCNGFNDGQAAVNLVGGGAGNGVLDNYSFQWSVPGVGDTIYLDDLPGNQNYQLTVTDNAGCSATFSFFLGDQQPIVPNLGADSLTCFGTSDGSVTVINTQSVRPISGYQWSNGGTGLSIGNLSPGTYTVVATDTQGCTGSASATVFSPLPLVLELDVQGLVCNDDSNAVIQAVTTGGTTPYSFFWNIGSANSQIANLGPGTYTVLVTDFNGCTVLDSVQLSQPNPPQIEIETMSPVCFGNLDGLARLTVTGGASPYRYSLNGQAFSGSSIFLGLGAGTYTAAVLDALGCTTSVQFTLDQPPPVMVDLGPDLVITLGDSILIQPSVTDATGMPVYSWQSTLVDSFYCAVLPDCEAIWVSPVYSNTYMVTVTDENGCQNESSVLVEVEKPRGVYVPSGFSPNGDGNNDLLMVHGKSRQIRSVKVFRVFDRWGELVYEDLDFNVNDQQRGWDGNFRGDPCQTGVYVWYAEVEYLDGFEQSIRGNTTLIR